MRLLRPTSGAPGASSESPVKARLAGARVDERDSTHPGLLNLAGLLGKQAAREFLDNLQPSDCDPQSKPFPDFHG